LTPAAGSRRETVRQNRFTDTPFAGPDVAFRQHPPRRAGNASKVGLTAGFGRSQRRGVARPARRFVNIATMVVRARQRAAKNFFVGD